MCVSLLISPRRPLHSHRSNGAESKERDVLDTIMALWNQRRRESRQRAGRIGLVSLLLCISASLLLVILSGRSTEKSAMDRKDAHQQVIVQPDVTARGFPTPSPTVKVAARIGPPRTHFATVVATAPVSTPPPGVVYPVITPETWSPPAVERAPVKKEKKQSARPSVVKRQVRRARPHKITRVKVVPIATIIPMPTHIPTATATNISTATATPPPTATPVATATASATPTASVQDPAAVPVIQPFTPDFLQRMIVKERNNV